MYFSLSHYMLIKWSSFNEWLDPVGDAYRYSTETDAIANARSVAAVSPIVDLTTIKSSYLRVAHYIHHQPSELTQ